MRTNTTTVAWVLAALLLAAAIRLPRVLATDFPLNDGGIFDVMAGELAANHLALPLDTSYNNAGIPFAYPPLGLYLAAVLHLATGISILALQRVLPLLANLLAIPVVFFLARHVLRSTAAAGVAALIFVVLPRSYAWLIMGGGLTRSFGFLFLCLAALFGYRAFVERERRAVVATGLCLALAVLSHPEMGIDAAAWLVVLVASRRPDRWRIARAFEAAAIAIALVAPWLLTLLLRHGVAPFLGAAGNSGFWLTGSLARLASPTATGEVRLPLLACLALLGALVSLARFEFVLPGWALAALVLTPRAALTTATVPLALLAASALDAVVRPGIASALAGDARPPGEPRRPGLSGRIARDRLAPLAYILLTTLIVGYTAIFSNLARSRAQWNLMDSLPRAQRDAMAWVAGHTPPTSAFVVASSAAQWIADPVDAWFPALTARASVATPNGAEWLPHGEFARRVRMYGQLKRCPAIDEECLDLLVTAYGARFTHVYVSKPASPAAPGPLTTLASSNRFVVVYDGPGAIVYATRQRLAPPSIGSGQR
jgi:hypothetical protein